MHNGFRAGNPAPGSTDDLPNFTNASSLTNQQLVEEIEKMFSEIDNTPLDVEKLEDYLSTLQQRAPVAEEYSPEYAWQKLQSDHPLLFADESVSISSPFHNHRKILFKKAARVFIIAAIITICTVITATAFGLTTFQELIDWGIDTFVLRSQVSGSMELPPSDQQEYISLEDALSSDSFTPHYVPTWIPEDFSLATVERFAAENLCIYVGEYESDRGYLYIDVNIAKDSGLQTTYEKNDGGYIYTYKNTQFYIYQNAELYCTTWQCDDYICNIFGPITEEELLKMIRSIFRR